ncbi:MAG: Asp-tRNA(Asn)/Glu-tRNA(Gln) amidotransferase subunit GatB [Holosporales bacterium]|jgi:aspartyl-tRNA(Asn)/glutamyl-tRNA(Gln) amidotransferase subunit B|nr:Asp-tRNA(Asn)/Glu-tRNA(Gln) amidotransferase subunit GatB [Holosporales bacterium]
MSRLIHGWEVVVGLEVHAQVATKAKLFSSSPTDFGSDPNTNVSFYDAAMPGMLPVLNGEVVNQAIKTGFGINAKINRISRFDRKNYFYPDLPAGYQISQLFYPIVSDGVVEINLQDGSRKTIGVERIHIEQDAGKSIHDLSPTCSYIDLNRSGVPLMEIVSKPDMRSSYEAMQYVKKLRAILKYIGSCECNMDRGNLRVDANVSVRKPGEPFGNRVEVKNINSIRFLGQAIDYEVERQIDVIGNGGRIVQETRLFDSSFCETRSMRSKEDAADYRYFPDPDLKPVILSDERIEKLKAEMPELPDVKHERFTKEYCLPESDADVLIEEKTVANYFEKAVKASKFKPQESAKLIANWMIVELFAVLNKNGQTIEDIEFPVEHIAKLVDLILDKTISGKIAKTVFAKVIECGDSPAKIVDDLGLVQIQDESVITSAIDKVIQANASQVEQYKAGKVQLFGFFVGQVMRELHGKGNPEMINKILQKRLP